MREPPKGIRPYDRSYFPPLGAPFAEKLRSHGYREFFKRAIERRTPEVVEDLARVILPIYTREFRRIEDATGSITLPFEMAQDHPLMVQSWHCRKSESYYANWERVRRPLISWAYWYGLTSDWCLQEALDALLQWTILYGGRLKKFEHPVSDGDRRRIAAHLSPHEKCQFYEETRRRNKAIAEARVLFPSWQTRGLFPAKSKTFTFEAWDGYDVKKYFVELKKGFAQYCTEYEAQAKEIANKCERVESLSKPERFEMLALYICRQMSRDDIAAELNLHKDATVIYRDIQKAAKLVGLSLKPVGRPRLKTARPQRWSDNLEVPQP